MSPDTEPDLKTILAAIHDSDRNSEQRHTETLRALTDLQAKYDELNEKSNQLRQDFEQFRAADKDQKRRTTAGISYVEQRTLENNILMAGVPELEKGEEECIGVVKTILNSEAPGTIVISATRMGKKVADANQGKRPILVKLADGTTKEKIINEKRKKKINCADISYNNQPLGKDSEIIYINEHLTTYNSKMFSLARDLKRKGAILFAWVKNGIVFVREREGGPAIRILYEGDLRQFVLKSNGKADAENDIQNRGEKRKPEALQANANDRDLRSNKKKLKM